MRWLIGSMAAVALMAQSQAPTDARALLVRSGGLLVTAGTVRLEGTESSELLYGGDRRDNSGKFKLEHSGARTRLEDNFGDTTELTVVDGANRWRYNRKVRVYWQYPAPAGPVNDPLGRIQFSRDPVKFVDATVLREESLEFGGKQVPCFVVHAKYAGVPGNSTAREVEHGVDREGQRVGTA